MAADSQSEADETKASLDLLQIRLQRLEFLLSGASDPDGIPAAGAKSNGDATVLVRLASLKDGLSKVRSDVVVGEMIHDIEAIFNRYPEIRKDTSDVSIQDPSVQASTVLANATLYPETASRLASLQTLEIPPAESSAKLTSLRADIDKSRQTQKEIDDEVQELRLRSAQCLEWWVKTGIVDMGDMWEEWEYRMTELERQIARFERLKKAREGYL